MFVSTFKIGVIIYVDFKGGKKMKTIGISAMLSARYQSKEISSAMTQSIIVNSIFLICLT
jgi:hypothetical protein